MEDQLIKRIKSELSQLVGLNKVKDSIMNIIANLEAWQIRAQAGLEDKCEIGLNFVFIGNPGTGKTTVARILAKLLAAYGVISEPEVVTCTKGQLIDGIVGGGSRNVEKMFEEAIGKVLFIDEAYQLANSESKDALDALTNMLTDERFKDNLAVILAGYPGEMAKLISSNPRLKRRFMHIIDFEDFNNNELTEIFRRKLVAEHFTIGDEALAHARAYFASLRRNKDFGNARETEKLREKVRTRQGRRLTQITNPTKEDVFTILPQDFPNYGRININVFMSQQGTTLSPMEKLNKLEGLENIKEQFEQYRKVFKHYRDGKGVPFRPHMVLMGNPGTGKTTVARLFAEILHEDGLLSQGQLIEATPSDLISKYIGQTRSQTQAVCDKAKGGILFIDEAYGLMNDFGKEAIEVLIHFMENDDSLVIFAGYTEETMRLINEGNPGLKYRLNESLGLFHFEDYEPDSLFNILVGKLNGYEMTEECKSEMRQIIQYQYEHRDEKRWGNAGTMEIYADEILIIYFFKHNGQGIIDVDCIPERLRTPKNSKKQLKDELTHLVNDIQMKLKQLQSKLDELSEE